MNEMEPRPPIVRAWWVAGAGLALAWIVYLMLWGPRGGGGDLPPPRLEGPSPGARADYDWTPVDLDGRPVAFARYRGRAVFLNVWATWCPPCVAELPAIARLAADPALRDVAFVCVSIDEDLETVRRFVGTQTWKLPVFRADAAALPDVFQTEGIPATFVIAPDGRIVLAQVGSAQWDDPRMIDFLKALAPPPSDRGGIAMTDRGSPGRPDRPPRSVAGMRGPEYIAAEEGSRIHSAAKRRRAFGTLHLRCCPEAVF